MFYYDVNEQIRLRLLEMKFAEEIYHLVDKNRSYLREWLPWVDETKSPEDTKKYISSSLQRYSENNGFHAVVFYKGKIAGCMGLHAIDWNHRKTSIGYWLAPEFQGKGIMTESCRAVIRYLFEQLELNRVEIRAAVHNGKSRAIPERLGFSREGIVRSAERLHDRYADLVVYGLLRSD